MKRNKKIMIGVLLLGVMVFGLSKIPMIQASNEEVTINNLDSVTNRTTVSTSAPQITVLTPGQRCLGDIWSNDGSGKLTYDSSSLIERLRAKNGNNTVVYLASIDEEKGTKSEGNKTVAESRSVDASDSTGNERIGAESHGNMYYNQNDYNDLNGFVLIPQYINKYYFDKNLEGASGKFSDDWQNRNVQVSIMIL